MCESARPSLLPHVLHRLCPEQFPAPSVCRATPLSIQHHFASLRDPRLPRTRLHDLSDILVIALCAVIGGADSWYQIEEFGHSKRAWFARFLTLRNGIPSHDTFSRVFAALDPQAFQACFVSWMNAVCGKLGLKFLQIDGKSHRGSADKGKGLGCLHTVSIWAAQNGLTFGQLGVDSKSNEITAIPKLLDLLDLEGAIVTIDAIGCQKEIVKKIIKRGGDYILAVKENQPTLYQDIEACFLKAFDEGFRGLRYEVYSTTETNHGRQEERIYTVIYDPPGLSTKKDWQSVKAIIHVSRERRQGDAYSHEAHYYISSSEATAEVQAKGIRSHSGIENKIHWVLDVVFGEDACHSRAGHSAENLGWLRRVALSLLKLDDSKGSIAVKRKRAGWNDDFLEHLLALLSEL